MAELRPWPIIRQGDKGNRVRTLQYLLRSRGFDLAVDADFGPRTADAVRSYQREKGLLVDGIVGEQTWQALIVTVRRGSTGEAVKGAQEELNDYVNLTGSRPKIAVDGDFGAKTEELTRAFQTDLKRIVASVTVDGVIGPVTWQGLVGDTLQS